MASRVKPSDSRGSTGRSRSTSLRLWIGRLDSRPLARREGERNAERLERNEKVGKEDRGIEAELADRLERDLDRELRSPADLEKRVRFPDLPIFRKVATRLAHEPDGRPVDRLAAAGFQEPIRAAHLGGLEGGRSRMSRLATSGYSSRQAWYSERPESRANLFHAPLPVDLRQHHPLAGVERDLFSRLALLGQNELGNEARVGNLLLQKLALVAPARALEQQNGGVLPDRFLALRSLGTNSKLPSGAAHQLEERLFSLAGPSSACTTAPPSKKIDPAASGRASASLPVFPCPQRNCTTSGTENCRIAP